MPQQIQIPGHGLVEFPDGMTDEQIVLAIKSNSTPEANDVGYIQGRVNAVKQLGNPDFWKSIGSDLSNFPPVTPETVKQINQAAYNTGLSALPVSSMSAASRVAMLKPEVLTPTQQILANAQKFGLVVPPSEINPQNLNVLESISGKAATRQNASQINQPMVNKIINNDLGISANTTLTTKILQDIRSKAGNVYADIKSIKQPIQTTPDFVSNVKNLSGDFQQAAQEFPDLMKNKNLDTLISNLSRDQMSSNGAVELSKKLRFDAKANLKAFDNPEKQALGLAQRKAAGLLEDLISENLVKNGQGTLATKWDQARTLIAKSHDAESALNVNGNIEASVLGKMVDKGKPMSGGFQTVGEFANAFPHAVQDVTKAGSPNVSNLKAMLSPLFAGGGAIGGSTIGMTGPGAMLGGALPYVAPSMARNILFSKLYQSGLTKLPSSTVSNFPIQRGILGGAAQNGLLGGPENLGLNPYGILGQ